MTGSHVEHDITVSAAATDTYRLLAEVQNWPRIFPPTVHVERLSQDGADERIRIWATANGQVRSWTSRRVLDPTALRIEFRQEVSPEPVASMGGTWIVEARGERKCRVRLLHDYRAIGDDPDKLALIDQAVDANSRSELAALKANVELATAAEELTFSFEDSVQINGPAGDAYAFVNEAGLWARRLPHVAAVSLTEDAPGVQTLEMATRATDGSTHTTKSYRVCLAPDKIAYKQVTLPDSLTLHTGVWTFVPNSAGVLATSRHTVVINRDKMTEIDVDVATARQMVRNALGGNSRATLGLAKSHVETGS